ncbi:glycosyltransferase 87 family protein, partial [Frankia nepalensis]
MPPDSPRGDNSRTTWEASAQVPGTGENATGATAGAAGEAGEARREAGGADRAGAEAAGARGWRARIIARAGRPWSAEGLWGFWAVSRAVLLVLALYVHPLGAQHGVDGDLELYAGWGDAFVHGRGLPSGDDTWQYPPGAALVFAVPAAVHALVGLPYRVGFPLFMLALDAAVTAALARRGSSRRQDPSDPERVGTRAGARVWLLGTTALGPVTLARFDLVPAACVVAGLLALGARADPGRAPSGGEGTRRGPRYGRAGLAAAAGAMVKVWPAFLLVACGRPAAGPSGLRPAGGPTARARPPLPPLARLAAGALAAAAVVVVLLAAAGATGDLLGFLRAQQARGLQLEAVPATVFVVARMFGAGQSARYSYGSSQFDEPAARAIATACSLVEVGAVAVAVLVWWARPRAADGARVSDRLLALLLVVLVTSRVLSPQYLIWALAVAAAGVALRERAVDRPGDAPLAAAPAARPGAGRSGSHRGTLVLLLVAAVISQVVYPWRYNDVIQGRVVASLLLVARNLLLLAACWRAVRLIAPRPAAGAAGRPRARVPRP